VPTYEATNRFWRDHQGLTQEAAAAFRATLPDFIEAIRNGPPYPHNLRIKPVQGTRRRIYEVSFANDGRATFHFGEPLEAGEAHVVWRRVGDHSVLGFP
jgi:hypothetical protein